jgi:hypothetical protein
MSKSTSTKKTTAARGIDTMNTQGSPVRIGVNPNSGMPPKGNISGSRGGMPGFGGSANGGKSRVANTHMGMNGSGHVMSESRRSSSTGYTGSTSGTKKAPGDIKVKAK